MRFLFLVAASYLACSADAQGPTYDDWDWHAQPQWGCFQAIAGQPRKPCADYWHSVDPNINTNTSPSGCDGICESTANATMKCADWRWSNMTYSKRGTVDEMNAQTPLMHGVSPGGDTVRKRMLKCREFGNCLCQYNETYDITLCEVDLVTRQFDHHNTFQGDLGGGACPGPPVGGPPPGYPPSGS